MDNPYKLMRIKARIGEVLGSPLPGVVGQAHSEIDEEIESGSADRFWSNLVDPG